MESGSPQAVFLSYAREDARLRQAYGGQADATQLRPAFSAAFASRKS